MNLVVVVAYVWVCGLLLWRAIDGLISVCFVLFVFTVMLDLWVCWSCCCGCVGLFVVARFRWICVVSIVVLTFVVARCWWFGVGFGCGFVCVVCGCGRC